MGTFMSNKSHASKGSALHNHGPVDPKQLL